MSVYAQRGGKRTKGERRRARFSGEQGARTNLGGEKRKEPKIISDGKHRILKIGTESRGNHSLCLGLELHHPIMSKLWNLDGQTKRKKERKIWWSNFIYHQVRYNTRNSFWSYLSSLYSLNCCPVIKYHWLYIYVGEKNPSWIKFISKTSYGYKHVYIRSPFTFLAKNICRHSPECIRLNTE